MVIHRLAYLSRIRNVPSGLQTRSQILENLSNEKWYSTAEISQEIPVTSATVLYHLKNMEREDVVKRNSKTRKWRLAEIHQIALTEFIGSSKKKRK